MRYILDDMGYVSLVSCNPIECDSKSCTEYKGKIPLGYYSLAEWIEKANIRAYKIVDGTFTYDPDRAAAIELEIELSNNIVVLYDDENGSYNNITLKNNIDNYDYVEIFYIGKFESSGDNYCYTKVFNPSNKQIELLSNSCNEQVQAVNIHAVVKMSGNTLSWLRNFMCYVGNGGYSGSTTNCIRISKIIGYKELKQETITYEEPDLSIDANVPNEEPITPTFTIADYWIPYNNVTIDGTANRVGLDAWISATNDDNYNALALEFTLTETHNLKAAFEFTGYEGCPRYQNAYIEKDGSILWDTEIDLAFESNGATFARTINQVLEAGTYKLLIGSWSAMDFGIKCTEFSLSTEIPTNLLDLSSYGFPTTKDGLTFNYDDTEKTLTINGYSNTDFGLYIPCVIGAGNYTFSYSPIQTNYGFYFSIDSWGETALNGWGKNLKTFTATYDTSQMILWFDAGYTYDNMKLKLNLVKND